MYLFSYQVPKQFRILPHLVSDVNLLGAVTREGRVHRQDVVTHKLFELVAINEVLGSVAAAKVEVSLAHQLPFSLLPCALLKKNVKFLFKYKFMLSLRSLLF